MCIGQLSKKLFTHLVMICMSCPSYLAQLYFIFQGLKQQEDEQSFQREFPPCNMEYKVNKGTRYWCTTQSGGIERELAGYPIQLFNQDTKTYSCVCMEKENFDLPQFRKYENCEDKIRSCFVPETDDSKDDE